MRTSRIELETLKDKSIVNKGIIESNRIESKLTIIDNPKMRQSTHLHVYN